MNRSAAQTLDDIDPLARHRDEFVADDGVNYMDGNSLGRLPRRTVDAIAHTVEKEWGEGLVRSWRTNWVHLPATVGDKLGTLIGAGTGETLISDQTSLNLYKLAAGALEATGRADIVSSASNFPSDLYILEGVATARGGRLRLIDDHGAASPDVQALSRALDAGVGLVSLSHIDYRSSAVADMATITAAAHDAGALALWDLSHSVGVYPVDLGGAGADLGVGCTYKYLNGGPGSPGFLYVARALQDRIRQPIHGWFGHADQFAFSPEYQPALGIARFAVGTPPIISLRGAEAGIDLVREVGIGAIRAKSMALTSLCSALIDADPRLTEFTVISPDDPEGRGGHVGIAHPAAWQVAQALVEREVVPDFRAPDVIRLAPSPLYTRFVDVWDAVDIIGDIVATRSFEGYPERRHVVT